MASPCSRCRHDPGGTSHVEDLVEVLEVIAGEGVTRPVLVGHSMGGGTAAALAGTRPDLAAAVVLEDPGARRGPLR